VPWIDGRGALVLRAVHELSTAETASLTGRGVIGERPGGAAARRGAGRMIHLPRGFARVLAALRDDVHGGDSIVEENKDGKRTVYKRRWVCVANLRALSHCLIDLSLASNSRAYDRDINAVIDPSKARCGFHGVGSRGFDQPYGYDRWWHEIQFRPHVA
jgi:hypothetical protein